MGTFSWPRRSRPRADRREARPRRSPVSLGARSVSLGVQSAFPRVKSDTQARRVGSRSRIAGVRAPRQSRKFVATKKAQTCCFAKGHSSVSFAKSHKTSRLTFVSSRWLCSPYKSVRRRTLFRCSKTRICAPSTRSVSPSCPRTCISPAAFAERCISPAAFAESSINLVGFPTPPFVSAHSNENKKCCVLHCKMLYRFHKNNEKLVKRKKKLFYFERLRTTHETLLVVF